MTIIAKVLELWISGRTHKDTLINTTGLLPEVRNSGLKYMCTDPLKATTVKDQMVLTYVDKECTYHCPI